MDRLCFFKYFSDMLSNMPLLSRVAEAIADRLYRGWCFGYDLEAENFQTHAGSDAVRLVTVDIDCDG